jgi:hypothetical protein
VRCRFRATSLSVFFSRTTGLAASRLNSGVKVLRTRAMDHLIRAGQPSVRCPLSRGTADRHPPCARDLVISWRPTRELRATCGGRLLAAEGPGRWGERRGALPLVERMCRENRR